MGMMKVSLNSTYVSTFSKDEGQCNKRALGFIGNIYTRARALLTGVFVVWIASKRFGLVLLRDHQADRKPLT
jgi:hypothetical protein